jgi:hypothetical protein
MKTYVEVEVKLHAFLILELAGFERSASWSNRLTRGKESAVFIGLEARWAPESVSTLIFFLSPLFITICLQAETMSNIFVM